MQLRKLLIPVLAVFAAYYAITNPTRAADFIHTIAAGIASFASALASGGH
ncbi:MAG: hypothetical protein QOH97_4886 [Actinoplanes sp.]|jgi:hypothetical protein|nr:hypothetical protein [Actinoplanes sp.]